MKFKNVFFTTVVMVLLFFSNAFSQSLSPEVFVAAGDSYSDKDIMISWSIGECIIETFSNSTTILTQGFHQPAFSKTSTEDISLDNKEFLIYPNPSSDFIYLKIKSDKEYPFYLDVINLHGKSLLAQTITTDLTKLNLSTLPSSTYLLRLYSKDNKFLKSFKLQKIGTR